VETGGRLAREEKREYTVTPPADGTAKSRDGINPQLFPFTGETQAKYRFSLQEPCDISLQFCR
jgi:hypothetical protein